MKKELIIIIPDNLTPRQEALMISHKLLQEAIPYTPRNKAPLLDNAALQLIYPETLIRIIRQKNEHTVELFKCPVCGTQYDIKTATYYFTNYGGSIRRQPSCSVNCVNVLVSNFPGRIAAKRKLLRACRTF